MTSKKVVYYLKINSDNDEAFACLQFWINVASINNSTFFIICDSSEIKEQISHRCKTDVTTDIGKVVISSMRDDLNEISKVIADGFWENASNAHLTTFLHSKHKGIDFFWNIDADDTVFLENERNIAQLLKNVENIAIERNIDIISLDMWYSFHKEIEGDWTFGVTFVNSLGHNWIEEIRSHINDERLNSWWDKKKKNVDSFFFFLRNVCDYSIESFYFKNTKFIHWKTICGPLVYNFSNGVIKIPVHMAMLLFGNKNISRCEILNEVIPIELNIEQENILKNDKRNLYIGNSIFIHFPVLYRVKQIGFRSALRKCMRLFKRKTVLSLSTKRKN